MNQERRLWRWLNRYVEQARLPADFTLRGDLRIDSRLVQQGDVFVAIAGTTQHGAHFVRSAVARGAVCVLTDLELNDLTVPVISVPQLPDKLYSLAEAYYAPNWRKIAIVAVTGTNGKSSVASQIAYAGQRLGYGGCEIGTVSYAGPNYTETARETTPHFVEVLRLLARWQQAVPDLLLGIEASSHALDQQRLGALPVDVAVFTNLSHDHLDYHRNLESYRQAKHKLFKQPRGAKAFAAVTPYQDPASVFAMEVGRVTTTFARQGGDYSVAGHVNGIGQMTIRVQGRVSVSWAIAAAGQFQALNSVAAYAALLALGHDATVTATALSGWPGVPGRMELVLSQPFLAFVDYAHTPAALETALSSAREYVQPNSRLYCLFGCGGDRDRTKRPHMGAVAERLADVVYLTSDNPRSESPEAIANEVLAGCKQPGLVRVELDRGQAISSALSVMRPGDVLLVAGKGHESGQVFADRTINFDDREELRKWKQH